jgi:hypothetical protein
MKFTRTDWKYLIDTLLFLCTVGIVVIGVLLGFVIPEGSLGAGQSKYFLGVHRHQWGHIHLWLSLTFTVLLIIHVVLAWGWIKGKAKGLFGRVWKAALGLTVLAALIVPLVFWAVTSKNDAAYAEFGQGQRGQRGAASDRQPRGPSRRSGAAARPEAPVGTSDRRGEAAVEPDVHGDRNMAGRMEATSAEAVVTGRMTLREIEQNKRISAKDLAAKIGLPEGVSLDETLGRLLQIYGFDMQAVRDAAAELLKAKRPPRLS